MAVGMLQDVTLGYQFLWNVQRQMAGTVLTLDALPGSGVGVEHLIKLLGELWQTQTPALVLSTPSPASLATLLDLTPSPLAHVLVSSDLLTDPAIAQRVQRARQRGLSLIWRGQPGQNPLPAVAASFGQNIISLTAEDALMALRVSLRRLHSAEHPPGLRSASPVRAGQIYDGVASRVLAEHCLDQQGAVALLGWPMEDVLYSYRHTRIQPGQHLIGDIIKAIDAEASMDDIERGLGEEPMLAYRFLRFVNSAGLGLRQEIDALRQGMMVLGLTRTKNWLQELLPHASHDLNLNPVRQGMVVRARFMAQLLEVGESEALQRELSLCGLLSQIDLLQGEPMTHTLRGLPLPSRVKEALLSQTGPYWPYLDVATAMETSHLDLTRERCVYHDLDPSDVNLALLRTLAALRKA